jgi:hypothetical protein
MELVEEGHEEVKVADYKHTAHSGSKDMEMDVEIKVEAPEDRFA